MSMLDWLRVIGETLAAIGAIVAAAYGVWRFTKEGHLDAGEEVAISLCRADYARARTATDSAIVDLRTPIVRREQAPIARSCGELRRAGLLADAPVPTDIR